MQAWQLMRAPATEPCNSPPPPTTTHTQHSTQSLQVVRTAEQIRAGMAADEGAGGANRDDANLVAYWKFDEGKGYTVKVGAIWRDLA